MLNVSLGSPRQHQNLTIYPLLAPGAADLPYDLLCDAVAAGTLTIGERGDGTVPVLVAKNAGARTVLLLDGEQLLGARQNRMTNRSILLAAGEATEIPVYCMEQGRWHFESDTMAPAPQHSPAKMRRRARETEARCVAAGVESSLSILGEAQLDVWADVADTLGTMKTASHTKSLDAAFVASAGHIEEWIAAFALEEQQVGLLAFVAGAPLGMDLIGAPRLYGRLHERLLRGYVMDALEQARRPGAAAGSAGSPSAGQGYLDAVRAAARTLAPSVGLGCYYVLSGDVIGGELVDAGRVAHLSAFPALDDATPQGTRGPAPLPVAPPSRRRRHL